MKIIDLLNKIANGEEVPKQFVINEELCIWQNEQIRDAFGGYLYGGTGENLINYLNDEVEIIEEPKDIEKPKNYEDFLSIDDYIEHLRDKIIELTDVVNELKKENK